MKYKILFLALGFIFSYQLKSQNLSPYVHIDFDDCQISDAGILDLNLSTGGAPECGCGLNGDALYFNGSDDFLSVDDDISNLFNEDFTLSFYLQVHNTGNTVDIISFQKECKRDSSFTLKYIPSINECRLDIVKNLSRSNQINFNLEEGKCWQHITIIRDGFTYLVYLNGKLVASESTDTDYYFSPSSVFSIANSPCHAIGDERLFGAIEELKIYRRALNDIELQSLELNADKIINRDTTLLLGESLQIEMGPNCAESFYWTNTGDLDNPGVLNPMITPDKNKTYHIYFQNENCLSNDSINIYVLAPEELECNDLLLPNAFSPNGDNLNESFGISNKFIVDELISFDIYSRLGNRVYHAIDKHSSWDGSYQGTRLNPAKFAYAVKYICNNEEYQKHGVVTLIR